MRDVPSGSVRIAPVVDVNDDDLLVGFVDAVPHSVLPAAGTPQPGEWWTERSTDHVGLMRQRPGDELPRWEGGRFGEGVGQGSACTRRVDDPVRFVILLVMCHDARADAAS